MNQELVQPNENNPRIITTKELTVLDSSLQRLLQSLQLPSDKLFAPIQERSIVLYNIQSALSSLQSNALGNSYYVSKMIAASTVGLFDAALNYLWDELIASLRERIKSFGLSYFYDVVSGLSNVTIGDLKDESDLEKINDATLLIACKEIGFITKVGYKKIDTIRYLRNNVSAAHPNEEKMSGLELATYLQECIQEVISQPTDTVMASTARLLGNIKKRSLSPEEVNETTAYFQNFTAETTDRVTSLANGLFGMYVAKKERTTVIADNVRQIWPKLWPHIPEDLRHKFGLRQAVAAANADSDSANAAYELLEIADGLPYLTDDILSIKLNEALDLLLSAHQGWNNFFTEPAPAKQLKNLVGNDGRIPDAVSGKYLSVLLQCYLGNPYGVSVAAEPYYSDLLKLLSSTDAGKILHLVLDPQYNYILSSKSGQTQFGKLLDIIEPKLTKMTDICLLEAVRNFNGEPNKLWTDSNIRRLSAL